MFDFPDYEFKIYCLRILIDCPNCGRQVKERVFARGGFLYPTSIERCPKCGQWCSGERVSLKEC